MELSIETFMKALKDELDKQEIFLSECDFQLNLAKKLKDSNFDVILEYPIKKDELYKYKNNTTDLGNDTNSYIDIYCKKGDESYFIELKYKTMEEQVTRYGNQFNLKSHNCHTDNRYDVYKDIERLECCKKWYKDRYDKDSVGYMIFLTNYPNHHEPSSNQKKYPLSTEINNYNEQNLKVEGKYGVSWHEFKKINESQFEYLLVEI